MQLLRQGHRMADRTGVRRLDPADVHRERPQDQLRQRRAQGSGGIPEQTQGERVHWRDREDEDLLVQGTHRDEGSMVIHAHEGRHREQGIGFRRCSG